jgi:hypothetical protein
MSAWVYFELRGLTSRWRCNQHTKDNKIAKSSSPAFFKITSFVKSLVKTNAVASTMKIILVTTTVCPRGLDLGDIVDSFWVERWRKFPGSREILE